MKLEVLWRWQRRLKLSQVALDGGEDQLAAAVLMGRARLVERQTVHLGAATEPVDPERLELGVIIEKTRRVEPAGIVDVGEAAARSPAGVRDSDGQERRA
jgi:hypothetical protein